jgi:hypothetical protein
VELVDLLQEELLVVMVLPLHQMITVLAVVVLDLQVMVLLGLELQEAMAARAAEAAEELAVLEQQWVLVVLVVLE